MGRAVTFVFVAVLLAEPAHAQIVRPPSRPQVNAILALGFGPRLSLPGWNDRTRVFGQVLFGARMSNAVEGTNVSQLGAGIDVRIPIGMKLRFQVDYAIMRGAPGPRSIGGTRALIGVAFPIGH